MKNANDNSGNQTRDLPACSAVTQPIAPPRASYEGGGKPKIPGIVNKII
jgi:hypothetical protein